MMPPKRSIKIREKLTELQSIRRTKPLILHPEDFPAYRHALKIFNDESVKKISVRTTENGVELWING